MLGGIDPIILFNLFKIPASIETVLTDIPIVDDIVNAVPLAPVPIYLSEQLTGLYVDNQEKNIDVQTTTETLADGSKPKINQKGINSSTRINLVANKNSIGLTLLSAMMDQVFEKLTSREYSITYLNGVTTVFNGLLHSYSVTGDANDERVFITIELTRSTVETQAPAVNTVVGKVTDIVPLN